MSMLKGIEILADSDEGFDAAARNAVKPAAQSVRNIRAIFINDMNAKAYGGKITRYRVNTKISFLLDVKVAA
ncbi:MAG: dodecin domain-containing protein [Silicimonas sp.]|nr:dodecin domain-containing protein [Silicimonas sp.]